MGIGFFRRFEADQGLEVYRQIEGVVILDKHARPGVRGVGQNVVCVVGECDDMSAAVTVDGSANVSTNVEPFEVFDHQDFLLKGGGFDETLGEFGVSGGNVFAEITGRIFGRLVVAPVNFASTKAGRMTRHLPTNKGSTDPTPIVPVQAAVVEAGREFITGSDKCRSAARVVFTDAIDYLHGTDGAVGTGSSHFGSAGSNFLTIGVQVGDILVLGAGAPGTNKGTFRVKQVIDANTLDTEALDGTDPGYSTATALPFRLHPAATADSAGSAQVVFSAASGYTIPARPLTTSIPAATVLTPTRVPTLDTATSWDTLSGLQFYSDPATGFIFRTNVQGVNAPYHADMLTEYQAALNATLGDERPVNEISFIWPARVSSGIRPLVLMNALTASSDDEQGRKAILSPEVNQQTLATIVGDADPGVGANRNERAYYTWPAIQVQVVEAVGFSVKGADGKKYTDGLIDQPFSGFLASLCSVLPPEHNPGEGTPTVRQLLQAIRGFARGTPKRGKAEYILLKQKGVAGVKFARGFGFVLQSGITSSLTDGETDINRRDFADFVEASVAQFLDPYSKQVLTQETIDAMVGGLHDFGEQLKSVTNPSAARAADYAVGTEGNTVDARRAKTFFLQFVVEMLETGDTIVASVEVGLGVLNVSTTVTSGG